MNTRRRGLKSIVTGLFCLFFFNPLFAQVFDSGSDGSYGPINITTYTVLQVPDDGIFNATTVYVAPYPAGLVFIKNSRNTPVYILATGDVTIEGGIGVDGEPSPGGGSSAGGPGGPGGFDGGAMGVSGFDPGDGIGPGSGGGGDYATNAFGDGSFGGVSPRAVLKNGETYGTQLLMPLVGGSGGGGTNAAGGGGGAGAILIASNTEIHLALQYYPSISAVGAGYYQVHAGAGSGGAIRLVAPKISGDGHICAGGPGISSNNPCPNNYGGVGRVRIDTIDRSEYAIHIDPNTPQTHGTLMQVFPTTSPALDIIEAAGTTVPEGSTTPVDIFLPDGSPSSQDVVVQARDFTGVVPITVKITPDSGDSVAYDDSIDMSGGNPSTATVSVQIPVNVPVTVHAWTREP